MFRPHTCQTSLFRLVLISIVCTALLFASIPLATTSGGAPAQNAERGARRAGKPEGVWPDLEVIKNESHTTREPVPPIPSTIRSPKNPVRPWDGKRVGDQGTHKTLGQAASSGSDMKLAQAGGKRANGARADARARRAHASRNAAPPTVPDDQFIANFFNYAVGRAPNGSETTYWNDQLRVAYAQGQTSLKLAAVELGKTLFESAEYANRQRNDHWYVYDLYKTFLMREPDASGLGVLGERGAVERTRECAPRV